MKKRLSLKDVVVSSFVTGNQERGGHWCTEDCILDSDCGDCTMDPCTIPSVPYDC